MKNKNLCPSWDYCQWHDEKLCVIGSGRCLCEEAQAREFESCFERKDPLDKPATEITPYDVCSVSELF